MVGHWGLVFISLAVIVSVLGAYLAWQMIAAEVLFNPAKTDDMPSIFSTGGQNKIPPPPMAQQRHRPALCHQHAVLGGRVYADAQIVHFDVVESLSAGGRLWAADCAARRDLDMRAQSAIGGGGHLAASSRRRPGSSPAIGTGLRRCDRMAVLPRRSSLEPLELSGVAPDRTTQSPTHRRRANFENARFQDTRSLRCFGYKRLQRRLRLLRLRARQDSGRPRAIRRCGRVYSGIADPAPAWDSVHDASGGVNRWSIPRSSGSFRRPRRPAYHVLSLPMAGSYRAISVHWQQPASPG